MTNLSLENTSSSTERKRKERQRRKDLGQKQVWISPKVYEIMQDLDNIDYHMDQIFNIDPDCRDDDLMLKIDQLSLEKQEAQKLLYIHLSIDLKGS